MLRDWRLVSASLAVASAIAACSDFKEADTTADADLSDSGDHESGNADSGDASLGDSAVDAPSLHDSAAADASTDGASTADAFDAALGATGLDNGVTLPDLGETPCSDPGNPTVCGGVEACRMATPDSGRCDNCNPAGTCSHLIKTACSQSLDCDVDLQCFRGQCTLVCSLPAGSECGGMPENCVDVGYVGPPRRGLCDPAMLP